MGREMEWGTIPSFRIVSEDLTGKIQLVAEGVMNLNGKLDRRIDEINRKIVDARQEVIAAIKFSYAELDRRITAVEAEM